jgi:hypothetical protein
VTGDEDGHSARTTAVLGDTSRGWGTGRGRRVGAFFPSPRRPHPAAHLDGRRSRALSHPYVFEIHNAW